MRRKKKTLAAVAALASSISAVAQAGSVVIGNWGSQTPDGWFDWPTSGGTTYTPPPSFPGGGEYSYSTIGATIGPYSLALNPGGGGYTQSLAIKLEYVKDGNGNSEMQDFLNNTEFSIDETMNSPEWSDGTYAVTKLIINAPGIGFDDVGLPTSDTRNAGYPGGYTASIYSGISTGTFTWNYASLLPTIGANPGYVELVFYTETDYSTIGNWYFDNATLHGPAVNSTWSNLAGDDLWTSGGNWSSGVPSSAGDTATFSFAAIAANTTVSLNANQTVGTMNFNDAGLSYTIAQGSGNGTLTLSNGTGSAVINDQSGNHTISAPVSIAAGGLTVAVGRSQDTFTISGNISGAGGITLTGTSLAQAVGTVALSGTNTYQGATTVNGGTLLVNATGALPSTTNLTIGTATATALAQLGANTGGQTISGLTINAGSDLDVSNNHIFIDYGSNPDPVAAIRAYLINGRNGGTWNGTGGIDSSAAALPANSAYGVGYADSADPGNPAGLATDQIEIKYTLLGDATLTGTVTGTDFTILATNLGKTVSGWDQGDFLYTGTVTGSDFTALVTNLGKTASGADVVLPAADWAAVDAFAAANGLMADVPEPASAGLLVVAGLGILSRRRRVRKA